MVALLAHRRHSRLRHGPLQIKGKRTHHHCNPFQSGECRRSKSKFRPDQPMLDPELRTQSKPLPLFFRFHFGRKRRHRLRCIHQPLKIFPQSLQIPQGNAPPFFANLSHHLCVGPLRQVFKIRRFDCLPDLRKVDHMFARQAKILDFVPHWSSLRHSSARGPKQQPQDAGHQHSHDYQK